MQHNGVLYNFSNNHGYQAPGYLFNGDIPLVEAVPRRRRQSKSRTFFSPAKARATG